jgi:hypothetical protein
MALTGEQAQRLQHALISAFPKRTDLARIRQTGWAE